MHGNYEVFVNRYSLLVERKFYYTSVYVGLHNFCTQIFAVPRVGVAIGSNQRLHHATLQVITNQACASTIPGLPATNVCTSGAGGWAVARRRLGGPLTVSGRLVRFYIPFHLKKSVHYNFCPVLTRSGLKLLLKYVRYISLNRLG